MHYMFTFMNLARLGTGLQGLAHSELAFQHSLAYARDRLQMRSLTGPKNPAGPADPIIVHPDIRRMLLTQKAFAEGGRARPRHEVQDAGPLAAPILSLGKASRPVLNGASPLP